MAIEFHPIQEQLQKAADRFGDFAKRKLPDLVTINGITPEFITEYQDLIREGGIPIVYGGHFSHLDGLVMADVCKALVDLTSQGKFQMGDLKGFSLPMAITVVNGHQSKFMELVYPSMSSYATERGVELVKVVREKDVEKYGEEKPNPFRQAKPFLEALQRGHGIALFPGGSVQAGRSTGYGELFGLGEIEDSDLLDMYHLVEHFGKRDGREPFFVPVGINGTHKLFSPDSLLPTPEGLWSLSTRRTFLEGLGVRPSVRIQVNIGMPIVRWDIEEAVIEDWQRHPLDLNYYLMGEVAHLVDPSARGIYGSSQY